ncbi:HCL448Wp [Eremothecium sinecaudum]|uniref:HCL448Wp n=1 Tax=Eremothecium sinecaudum TaxID=45286 RepID=A0A109UYC4_9SACH|nr:HCL448Wp [Eremothecium sinecaudum]AMD19703.1 HCL448Wp [Eremothecium sinecaudum]
MPKLYSYKEIAEHNTDTDIWIIINNKVYDCSKFVDEHPGGDEIIADLGGQDATEPFIDINHSEDAKKMLEDLYIGDVDLNSEPVFVSEPDTMTTTDSANEGNGILWLAFIFVFLAAASYGYYQNKWF